MRHQNPKKIHQKGMAPAEAVVLFAVIFALAGFLYSQFYWIDQLVKIRKCEENLKRIWIGLQIYANEREGGALPEETDPALAFARIFTRGNISNPRVFDCPLADGRPTGKPGTDLFHPSLDLKGVEFLYTRRRVTLNDPGDTPVVSDRPGSHPGGKVHVLHLDGTVTEEKELPSGIFD